MILCDVITRRIPRSIWWRLFVEVTWLRGSFESGCGPMYRGLVYRWAVRIGPLNVAVLRLK